MFALFNLGPAELVVLLLVVLLVVWPLWRVCTRAGFPGALALVAIIPFGLIVLLFVLAFAEWPALRRRPRQPEELDEEAAVDRPRRTPIAGGSGWRIECCDATGASKQPILGEFASREEADGEARRLVKEDPKAQVFVLGPHGAKYRVLP
jgi:hypothetical protein